MNAFIPMMTNIIVSFLGQTLSELQRQDPLLGIINSFGESEFGYRLRAISRDANDAKSPPFFSALPKIYGRMRVTAQKFAYGAITKKKRVPMITSNFFDSHSEADRLKEVECSVVTFAVAISSSELSHVERMWADGIELISNMKFRLFKGFLGQELDAFLENQTSITQEMMSGISYIVFEDFDLTMFSKIPEISVEVAGVNSLLPRLETATALNLALWCDEYCADPTMLYTRKVDERLVETKELLNCNTSSRIPDIVKSIEHMRNHFTNLNTVYVDVYWAINRTSDGNINILPCCSKRNMQFAQSTFTEFNEQKMEWIVGRYRRTSAIQIPCVDDYPIYPCTADDLSLVRLCYYLKFKRCKTVIRPRLICLPDDFGDFSIKDTQNINTIVTNFAKSFEYRNFIQHYANLLQGLADGIAIGADISRLICDYPSIYSMISTVKNTISTTKPIAKLFDIDSMIFADINIDTNINVNNLNKSFDINNEKKQQSDKKEQLVKLLDSIITSNAQFNFNISVQLGETSEAISQRVKNICEMLGKYPVHRSKIAFEICVPSALISSSIVAKITGRVEDATAKSINIGVGNSRDTIDSDRLQQKAKYSNPWELFCDMRLYNPYPASMLKSDFLQQRKIMNIIYSTICSIYPDFRDQIWFGVWDSKPYPDFMRLHSNETHHNLFAWQYNYSICGKITAISIKNVILQLLLNKPQITDLIQRITATKIKKDIKNDKNDKNHINSCAVGVNSQESNCSKETLELQMNEKRLEYIKIQRNIIKKFIKSSKNADKCYLEGMIITDSIPTKEIVALLLKISHLRLHERANGFILQKDINIKFNKPSNNKISNKDKISRFNKIKNTTDSIQNETFQISQRESAINKQKEKIIQIDGDSLIIQYKDGYSSQTLSPWFTHSYTPQNSYTFDISYITSNGYYQTTSISDNTSDFFGRNGRRNSICLPIILNDKAAKRTLHRIQALSEENNQRYIFYLPIYYLFLRPADIVKISLNGRCIYGEIERIEIGSSALMKIICSKVY